MLAWERNVLAAVEERAPVPGFTRDLALESYYEHTVREHGSRAERVRVQSQDITRWREKRELRGEPHDQEQFERELFSGRVKGTNVRVERYAPRAARTTTNGAVSRAPREATNGRRRGSRRGERARSSSSDDPDGEAEPPPRLCQCGCGQDLDELGKNRDARYADKTHAKRGQRQRDRDNPDRVVERNGAPAGRVRCDCGSEVAYPLDNRWVCIPCGKPVVGAYSEVNGRLADYEVLQVLAEEARRGAPKVAFPRVWKTRLSGDESRQLRRTGRERGYRFDGPKTKELT